MKSRMGGGRSGSLFWACAQQVRLSRQNCCPAVPPYRAKPADSHRPPNAQICQRLAVCGPPEGPSCATQDGPKPPPACHCCAHACYCHVRPPLNGCLAAWPDAFTPCSITRGIVQAAEELGIAACATIITVDRSARQDRRASACARRRPPHPPPVLPAAVSDAWQSDCAPLCPPRPSAR